MISRYADNAWQSLTFLNIYSIYGVTETIHDRNSYRSSSLRQLELVLEKNLNSGRLDKNYQLPAVERRLIM